ncbi:hypothetical protein evm_002981 [Chilo suppressalis]|nr:hypothetical protein evm_002981 [Chilo suppressalis]
MLLVADDLYSVTGFWRREILIGPQAEHWRVPLEVFQADGVSLRGSLLSLEPLDHSNLSGDINSIELPHQAEEKTEEIMDHISVLDEVLRMLLEIVNSCLTRQLPNNLHLVYALLHKRKLFEHHSRQPITQNIEMVIGYFSSRLQRVQDGAGGDLSVAEVLQCIKKGAEQWSSDRLQNNYS